MHLGRRWATAVNALLRSPADSQWPLIQAPLYDPATSILHFVDISENRVSNPIFRLGSERRSLTFLQVFHLNTHNLELSVEQFQEPVTCLALRTNGQGVRFWPIPSHPS
jgi:hypothetical protein